MLKKEWRKKNEDFPQKKLVDFFSVRRKVPRVCFKESQAQKEKKYNNNKTRRKRRGGKNVS